MGYFLKAFLAGLFHFRQPADVAIRQERQQRMLAEATTMASSSIDKTVERGAFGPMGASWTKVLFYLATVFGLRP